MGTVEDLEAAVAEAEEIQRRALAAMAALDAEQEAERHQAEARVRAARQRVRSLVTAPPPGEREAELPPEHAEARAELDAAEHALANLPGVQYAARADLAQVARDAGAAVSQARSRLAGYHASVEAVRRAELDLAELQLRHQTELAAARERLRSVLAGTEE